MFIDKYDDGTITEFESRDSQFLEEEFPSRGELDQNRSLYKLNDENEDDIPTDHVARDPLESGSSAPADSSSPLM